MATLHFFLLSLHWKKSQQREKRRDKSEERKEQKEKATLRATFSPKYQEKESEEIEMETQWASAERYSSLFSLICTRRVFLSPLP